MASISQDFADYTTNPLEQTLTSRFRLNWETWVYILIFVLAVFTRFYILGDRVMSHDESLHTKFSWDLYSSGNFAHTPLMHGPILFHVTALNYFLFGDNDFTARIYPAVLGILMVMFPLLFRRWLGRWSAILASIMFLISPLILYYNRYIREDTPSIFYTLVMVYCTFMYLNGPAHLRRKARWLYIFSAAMLASLATKEVAFMYIAIFGSILTLYWLVRMGQHFFKLPGKTLMYFVSLAALLGGVAALGMYVVLSLIPLDNALQLGSGSLEFTSLLRWTIAIAVIIVLFVVGTMVWAFRRSTASIPWMEMVLLFALTVVFAAVFVIVEERSHVLSQDSSTTSAPVVPGEDGAVSIGVPYVAWPLYLFWIVCLAIIALVAYLKASGLWRKLYRFAEFDILILMGTLILPWGTPVIMKLMNASPMSPPQVASAVQAAIPFVQFDLTQFSVQILLSFVPVAPAFLVMIVVGLLWNWKRWLISAAIFHVLFVFFFTTVFTNINGLGSGMIGSLGYWLEQQAVRRGNQPQYYYLVLIMPFYEFLPVIGSVLAMLSGLGIYWRHRRNRLEAQQPFISYDPIDEAGELNPSINGEEQPLGGMLDESASRKPKPWFNVASEKLKEMPFLLFVSWWAVFNLIAYTLAGEKMPWLATHMTTPMIFLAAWYFGGFVERIDAHAFWKRNWQYLLLLPILFVAGVQLISPFVVGNGVGGLEQVQLTRTFQWFAGIVIAFGAFYFVWRLVETSGWVQLRIMVGVVSFIFLSFLTFRSAWMASFINYDLATEFLVYAHGAPANKRVMEELQELSERITGGMELKFAYDFKISWPGAWYFRNFKNAVYLGENPSPRSLDDTAVVIVGDENRAAVEAMLEDRYYKFDYPRLWWPMQDYFNLTPQRIINTFDFSPENPQAAQIRQGMWNIWWSRDYTTYGTALGRDFSITEWPVSDRMYVFVRKDIAAQVWNLGVGDGAAFTGAPEEVNLCNENWQPLAANLIIDTSGAQTAPLNRPRQIAINADGQLYVAEEFNHRISVFNPDGTFAFDFGSQGSQQGQFERPNGVAIGPSGNIYVADTWNYRVQVFTPTGEFITSWGQRGEYGQAAAPQPFDGLWGPRAIAVDAQEQVYVADTGNKRIRVYTATGAYLRDIGSGGSNLGQLDEPSGVVVGSDSLLYVADTWNRRVSVFSPDGLPALKFVGADGLQTNNFRVRGWFDDLGNRPYLAIDSARNLVYVTDPDAGRVLVYNTAGNCVGSFGQLGRENLDTTQFNSIGGILVDAQGSVFVADAGAGRIVRFAPFDFIPAGVPGVINEVPEVTVEMIAPLEQEETPELSPADSEVTPEVTEAVG
ncbi:MAG: TIGR03663 family protein [Anaerolineae bacterium]|nr:TIGR03663 family protein [Anaerolineae bacterium]